MVIIEDDADIRAVLTTIFREAGFTVHAFATGDDGVEGVRRHRPQVVSLDLSLPDIDGFEVLAAGGQKLVAIDRWAHRALDTSTGGA